MELSARLRVQNVFSEWVRTRDGSLWVAPLAGRRVNEAGLVVASETAGLDVALLRAAGPECRHTVEEVSRRGARVCLRYRCNKASAPGCGLLSPVMDALRPILGAHGQVRWLRFEPGATFMRASWPPGGPEEVRTLRQALDRYSGDVEPLGLQVLDVQDDAEALLAGAEASRGLKAAELETVKVAVRNGYYESPRQCTMEDIASHFGLSKSAIYHRIHAAEREAVRRLVDRERERENVRVRGAAAEERATNDEGWIAPDQ